MLTPTEKIKQKLIEYFASVARAGRVFGMRDFNDNVMMNTYAAEERAVLAVVLRELVEEAVLLETSRAGFELTAKGLVMVGSLPRTAAAH